MNIVPPYVSNELDIHYEPASSALDKVERSGFVPPEKKIESFVNSGTLLQNYRAGGDSFELEGGESEFEEDSPEYREELTNDAENFDSPVLPQYMDVLSASEKMADLMNKADSENFERTEKIKKQNAKKIEDDGVLSKLADSVASKVIEKSAEANLNGKEA